MNDTIEKNVLFGEDQTENSNSEIKNSLARLKLEKMPEIFCEPGRALVAEAGSTIVKVILKKKQN